MINGTAVKEVCADWSESSMKMVIGMLAGAVFLVPCIIILICILQKDRRMKEKYASMEETPLTQPCESENSHDAKKNPKIKEKYVNKTEEKRNTDISIKQSELLKTVEGLSNGHDHFKSSDALTSFDTEISHRCGNSNDIFKDQWEDVQLTELPPVVNGIPSSTPQSCHNTNNPQSLSTKVYDGEVSRSDNLALEPEGDGSKTSPHTSQGNTDIPANTISPHVAPGISQLQTSPASIHTPLAATTSNASQVKLPTRTVDHKDPSVHPNTETTTDSMVSKPKVSVPNDDQSDTSGSTDIFTLPSDVSMPDLFIVEPDRDPDTMAVNKNDAVSHI